MIIVLLFILISIFIQYFFNCENRQIKLYFSILLGIFLFYIYSNLSYEKLILGDIGRYEIAFEKFSNYPIKELFQILISTNSKDPIYHIFGCIFSHLGFNFNIWRLFIGLFFASSFSFLIYKRSYNPVISFIIILSQYFVFTFSGLRQTISLSFILISYHFLMSKKYTIFFIFVIFAFMFHTSAIIFILAYLSKEIKFSNKVSIVLILISFFIVLIGEKYLRFLIANVTWNKNLINYATKIQGLSWSGCIIQLCIIMFYFYYTRLKNTNQKNTDNRSNIFFNCLLLGLCFSSFSTAIAEMFRISYYFSICSIIAIPHSINLVNKDDERKIIKYFVGTLFVMYILWSNSYNNLL